MNTSLTLSWESGDSNAHVVTYTVYFGRDTLFSDPPDSLIDSSGTLPAYLSYPLEDVLDTFAVYFWKVDASDKYSVTPGETWTFETGKPSMPPSVPDKPTGPGIGYIDEVCRFTTQTTDPDGDSVRYKFDFGDGCPVAWTSLFASGQAVTVSHTYGRLGSFYVSAKAQDEHGSESDWSDSMNIEIRVGAGACWSCDGADSTGAKVIKLGRGGSVIGTYSFNEIANDTSHPEFRGPISLAVDPQDGCVWIACTATQNRVFKLLPDCRAVSGFPSFPLIFPDGHPSTPCIDNNGDCWICVAFHKKFVRLERYTGVILQTIEDTGLSPREYPIAIALDTDNDWLWAVESNKSGAKGHVSKFDVTTGTRVFKKPGFNANWVDVDPGTHYCWVTDLGDSSVAKISPSGHVTKYGGFTEPFGVSVDPNSHAVWVADRGSSELIKLSDSGVEILRLSGLGTPVAVEVDPNDGSCWMSDVSGFRVVKVSIDGTELFGVGGSLYSHCPMGLSVNPAPDP
jgi:hypothetical protein